ncbi:MAG: stage V sporulation protein E [Firmicutes bacterium]|nr:stage V sporulation protein E [Bacillota bacterium]
MKKRSSAPDFIIFFAAITLLGIGVIMVFSASSVTAAGLRNDAYFYLKRQALWAGLGVIAMVIFMNINYRFWQRAGKFILVVTIILLLLVLIPELGKEGLGARRWLELGPVNVQPSEIAKLSLVIFLAGYLTNKGEDIRKFWEGLFPALLLLGGTFLLILKQPDLGTAAALTGTLVLMLFSAGAKFSHLLGLGLAALPGVYFAIVGKEYRASRFLSFLDPGADPLGSGYHLIQSLYALGSGGPVGLGLGRSRQKWYYLPERHTDFIFAIIGEELGFLGAIFVLLLFLLFAWRGFRIAITAPDNFGSLLAVGITTMISLQALVNIGVVTGSLPITGIPLPLISYGGSSLLPSLAGIGILLNISRYSRIS